MACREGARAWWPTGQETDPAEPIRMPHWCGGSSGAGTFLVRLWRETGDDEYRTLAEAAAHTVRDSRWHMGAAYCHGIAGDGHFLLDLADQLDEPRYHAWAQELATCLQARAAYRDGHLVVPDDTGEIDAGFGTGLAGVLSFLLRLRHGGTRPWMADDILTGHPAGDRPSALRVPRPAGRAATNMWSGEDGPREGHAEGRAAGPLRNHRGMPVMYRADQTALVAVIHEAEPMVAAWRNRLDPSAAAGVPAHVSVFSPFLAAPRVDDAVVGELTSLFGAQPAFHVRFTEFRRFPGVLYLAPDPDEPFRALTGVLATRWPKAAPAGWRLADVKPHLTVAYEQPTPVLDEVEASITTQLPIAAAITAVALFVHDGARWQQRMAFDLAR